MSIRWRIARPCLLEGRRHCCASRRPRTSTPAAAPITALKTINNNVDIGDDRISEMSKIVKTPDCVIQKQPDGSRSCAVHGKPLQQQNMFGPANPSGPGHLSAWVCPVTGKMLIEMEGL